MKIAVLLSGQPRLKPDIIENHKKYILNKNIDFFSHIWWDDSHMDKIFRLHSSEKYPSEDLFKEVEIIYEPKISCKQDYFEFDISYLESFNYETWKGVSQKYLELFTPILLFSIMCQSYSLKKSLELIPEIEKYDIILRVRFDTIFTQDLFNKLINLRFDENTVYIQSSMEGGHKYCGEFPNKPCDWFFLGRPNTIEKFVKNWYDLFPQLYKNGIIHANEAMKKIAELSDIKLILQDFGVIVKRQLDKDDKFVDWENYLNDFDDINYKIIGNTNLWPHWIKNVNFDVLKKIQK